jgi:hypothetical protein
MILPGMYAVNVLCLERYRCHVKLLQVARNPIL